MADNDLQLQLSIETDASIAKAIKEMETISKETSEIEKGLAKVSRQKAFDDLARDAAKLANETGDSAQATKLLTRELDKLGAKENEVERLVKQYQRLQSEIKQSATAQDRFDATSKNVALAGDVQSNLGAVSGLAGAAGAGGASQAIGIGGEVVALVEELPRLKESIRGMPSAISAAGQALGTSGAGFIGALGATGIALAAVSLAFKNFIDNAKKQAESLQSQIDVSRDVATDIAQGLTSTDASARIDELNRLREVELDIVNRAQTAYDQEITSKNALFESILKLVPQEQVLVDTIKDGEATASAYAQEIELLERAQSNGSLAANDAVIAEEELAQAREEAGQNLLEIAAYQGEFLALQQESANFDEEELANRKESLVLRKAQLEAELAFLQASGDSSDVVKSKIADLLGSLEEIGNNISFLDSSQAKSAAAANSAKKAEEELAKERERSAKSTAKAATQERRVLGDKQGGGRVIGGRSSARPSILSEPLISASDNNNFLEAMNSAGETLKDGIYSVRESLLQGIEDLRIGQSRDIADAQRTGNILAIRDITRNAERAGEDINRNAKRDSIRLEREYSNDIASITRNRHEQIAQSYEQLNARIQASINNIILQGPGGGFNFRNVARS